MCPGGMQDVRRAGRCRAACPGRFREIGTLQEYEQEIMSATIKGAAAELGTERIRKLLVQYAVPAVIAMTAASLYNMVDSIFIGHGVGPLAISGLALTFPLMNLAAAFGSLDKLAGASKTEHKTAEAKTLGDFYVRSEERRVGKEC